MKLSDPRIRPCDNCGEPLLKQGHATWYVLRITQAMINAQAANQVLGMHQCFQGQSLALAEIFAPGSDDAVIVFGEKDPHLWTDLVLCGDCVLARDLHLAAVMERRAEKEEPANAEIDTPDA